jgi:hypothetical protein
MPTYLSNELAGTLDGKTLAAPSGTKTRGNVVNARLKRYRATITLAGQLNGDQIQLCVLPPGATFAFGLITASVSLGTASFAVGPMGALTRYRGASPMTQVDWPNLFGAAAVAGRSVAPPEEVVHEPLEQLADKRVAGQRRARGQGPPPARC